MQVINAGIPGLTLVDNLRRLQPEILPLKPDMVISYHGVNGFRLLDPAIPPMAGLAVPAYKPRPLHLLARAEFRIKMMRFRRSLVPKTPPGAVRTVAPLQTKYADAYRQLIEAARTNHFRLVLANFSMAVNERSQPDVIAFYGVGSPSINWQIQANRSHSALIGDLAREYPEVQQVDTQADLDGVPGKFIDIVHLTEEGRKQLAENIFAGIKGVLQTDLAK